MKAPKLFTTDIYKINIPTGVILGEGRRIIQNYLIDHGIPPLPNNWDWNWKVLFGKYCGTLTKRISKYLYVEHQLKIKPEMLAEIGNIASQYVYDRDTYYVDFTNDFNWEAGDFGDKNSCFWTGREISKQIIRAENGYAIRFFANKNKKTGYGRAWIIPYANVEFMFNAYGIGLPEAARVYSIYKRVAHNRINLHYDEIVYGETTICHNHDVLCVNRNYGYIIGKLSDINTYCNDENKQINIPINNVRICDICDEIYKDQRDEKLLHSFSAFMFPEKREKLYDKFYNSCDRCIEKNFTKCDYCGCYIFNPYVITSPRSGNYGSQYCMTKNETNRPAEMHLIQNNYTK